MPFHNQNRGSLVAGVSSDVTQHQPSSPDACIYAPDVALRKGLAVGALRITWMRFFRSCRVRVLSEKDLGIRAGSVMSIMIHAGTSINLHA